MENKIAIPKGKKVFFASDNHLGAPNIDESKIRESHFLKWLNYVEKEVGALFLLGDLFDFWYEYKTVVPKGFVRVLGKIAEISDRGIPVHFFVGNHDQWMINYFEDELGINVYYQTKEFQIKKWKEVKNQNRKTFKLVQHKLTGFFSDFPNPKGDK